MLLRKAQLDAIAVTTMAMLAVVAGALAISFCWLPWDSLLVANDVGMTARPTHRDADPELVRVFITVANQELLKINCLALLAGARTLGGLREDPLYQLLCIFVLCSFVIVLVTLLVGCWRVLVRPAFMELSNVDEARILESEAAVQKNAQPLLSIFLVHGSAALRVRRQGIQVI